MSGRVLPDTNMLIALFDGNPKVEQRLQVADEVWLCVPVLGELLYGAMASSRAAQNVQRVSRLVELTNVLVCDGETARSFGETKVSLRKKGKPIPNNDLWIAALARQHRLTLLTRDSHFKVVDDLDLEMW
jgi:tRNA(fMet)-specific endonuclease VapC